MRHHYFSPFIPVTVIFLTLVSTSTPCTASQTQAKGTCNSTNISTLAPLPGNPVRKAVLDALRQKMKRLQGLDMVFVVKYLKVKNGWCWVHTLPQSPDGKNRYEDISALLQRKGGVWKVVELACTEEENPACLSNPAYFTGLKKRFPKVPEGVLPGEE